MNVFVTGPTGFVGRAFIKATQDRFALTGAVRSEARAAQLAPGVRPFVAGDIDPDTDWRDALAGIDAVLHLASRVHVLNETAQDASEQYRRVNRDGTLHLARAAADAGVRRFVFVSSIKAMAESSDDSAGALRETDTPHPVDPYGISKLEAEEGLWSLSKKTGMEVVVVRPPLVYGPEVRANFLNLMRLVHRGLPLPFGNVRNRRSMVGVRNLADFLATCMEHPAAAGEVFLISDGEDLSTTELIRRQARALGCPARLFPLPVSLLQAAAKAAGREAVMQRLFGSLAVDSTKAQTLLGWKAPYSVGEEMADTAAWYLRSLADSPRTAAATGKATP